MYAQPFDYFIICWRLARKWVFVCFFFSLGITHGISMAIWNFKAADHFHMAVLWKFYTFLVWIACCIFPILPCTAQPTFSHYKRLSRFLMTKSATIPASAWLLIYLTFDFLTWAKQHTGIMRSKHRKFIQSKCIFLRNSWQNDKAFVVCSVCSLCVCLCVRAHKTKGSNFNWIQMPAAWALWTAANVLRHTMPEYERPLDPVQVHFKISISQT